MVEQKKRGPKPRHGPRQEIHLKFSPEVIAYIEAHSSNYQAFFDQLIIKEIERTRSMSIKSHYIGKPVEWPRVCLAFEAVGFLPPTGDTQANTGAYVANIIPQYINELSENEVLDIIAFGLQESAEFLRSIKGEWSVQDVAGSAESYQQEQAERTQREQNQKISARQQEADKSLTRRVSRVTHPVSQ